MKTRIEDGAWKMAGTQVAPQVGDGAIRLNPIKSDPRGCRFGGLAFATRLPPSQKLWRTRRRPRRVKVGQGKSRYFVWRAKLNVVKEYEIADFTFVLTAQGGVGPAFAKGY